MRKTKRTIRHLQSCRNAQKAKEQRRKNKVAQDKQRQALRKRIENHTLTLKAAIVAVGAIALMIGNKGGDVVKFVPKPRSEASPIRKAA